MASPVDPTIGAPARGAVDRPTSGGAAASGGAARLPELRVGQALRGRVIAVLPHGGVLLGLLDTEVLASTRLRLQTGKTYDFVVATTGAKLTLTAVRPLRVPMLAAAAPAGLLGASAGDVGQLVAAALGELGSAAPTPSGQAEVAPRPTLQQVLTRLASGEAGAEDLQALGRRLGHDQEARVLRLAARAESRAEIRSLQNTLKASALEFLASEAHQPSAKPAAHAHALRALVEGFHTIEMDNAVRAEQGTPQWLPLPVVGSG